ncbi:TPA: hypothetical protein ACJ2UE_003648 [Yersinia enterocolitica]|jgi:hypothetical protein
MKTCLIQHSYVSKAGFLIASDHLGVAASIDLATISHKSIQKDNKRNTSLRLCLADRFALYSLAKNENVIPTFAYQIKLKAGLERCSVS